MQAGPLGIRRRSERSRVVPSVECIRTVIGVAPPSVCQDPVRAAGRDDHGRATSSRDRLRDRSGRVGHRQTSAAVWSTRTAWRCGVGAASTRWHRRRPSTQPATDASHIRKTRSGSRGSARGAPPRRTVRRAIRARSRPVATPAIGHEQVLSHPEDPEARLRDRRVERRLDAHRQDAPRVERVDDPVVPQPGRREVRATPRARRSRGSAPRRRRARRRSRSRRRPSTGRGPPAARPSPRSASSATTTGSAAGRRARPSRSCRPRTSRR